MDERFAQMRKIMAECGEDFHKAVPKYEYITAYPIDQLVELSKIQFKIMETADDAARAELHRRYNELRDSIEMIPNPPEKIMLWPKGKVPTLTEYKENPGLRHFHDPGFEPYMLEVLLPQDIVPKGAVVTIAGGEQGMNTINECYEICREFREKGYQGFILHSRPNNGPWSPAECGIDAGRALRIIRANAAKYRIDPDKVALAGFSNGGIAVDFCVRYCSGDQKVADYFPGYEPDELDELPGAPDVAILVYGARHTGTEYDYSRVVYPPTFFATGLLDVKGMENLYDVAWDLMKRGVKLEIHSFAGQPHGYAGWKIYDGVGHPNFDLWLDHADNFMQDVYANR